MFALNLPVADIKISQSQGKPTVYDFLRRRYVALTPEEWVANSSPVSSPTTRATPQP